MDREPCPFRIVDDAGGAFGFGLVGGAIWNFFGGIRNAPNGARMSQALSRMKARTPILGGSFAIWGTLFSVCDCSFTYIRKKEDHWNAIASGAATGGILAIRGGLKSAGKNALVGGVLLAAIEGLNIAVTRVLMPMLDKRGPEAPVDRLDPPNDPLRPRSRVVYDRNYESGPVPQAAISMPTSFDFEAANQFQVDTWDAKTSNEINSTEDDRKGESKPFWKVW